MSVDLIILFVVLVGIVVYLIYSRSQYEKNVVAIYEQKFQEWKEHSGNQERSCKKLVGLVYDEDYKLSVEILDDECIQRLERGKFDIKELS